MPDSPISATPYEILGVSPTADQNELRRAYRKLMRETHPDTGGNAARFTAVQLAWERIGTAEGRAAYDRGRSTGPSTEEQHTWAASAAKPQPDSRPRARSYGHPGGWRRERYLRLMREWTGRGVEADPYDPALVRTAPRELRHLLADALAEEETARNLADLGLGFTVWHDVATGAPDEKIDHIVLGPTGLFALLSEDFGGPVKVKRGELIGEAVAGDRPMHELSARAKVLSRALRVRFTALVLVLPDAALDESMVELGSSRGALTLAVRSSFLPGLMRNGLPGMNRAGGNELFDVRTRLQNGIRFVE
ncbi:curved DNA-binding protein CbpA [Okibacterium sp. HSC-33S16]|uniref:J domain-containing protein n=1 Tax=Okibacterium sp. HSC-33S16 TaxID=2910965 RepID=UPI00209CFEE2|nr:DnaJ domain-containing protein [Okibacterium sp. HSC-33S16]MCP2030985.1 curved DNA-binding protein CbpA [Okibacterium sp. HSC-33S16]